MDNSVSFIDLLTANDELSELWHIFKILENFFLIGFFQILVEPNILNNKGKPDSFGGLFDEQLDEFNGL